MGESVPLHFGNPLAEQRAFERGEALIDCSNYEVIALSGPDRLVWLDSLASQSLAGLQPGETAESLILDPHGHIEHRFLVADDGETTWLLLEPHRAGALKEWLFTMRFRMQVEISDHSGDLAILAATHPLESLDSLADATWVDPWPGVMSGGASYSVGSHPAEGFCLVFYAIPAGELRSDLVENWAGLDALDAVVLRAARPTMADVDDKTIPHELDLLRTAVHLNKGCYRGQETVAKVHNLGHPPRRAVLLHLDGSESELPTPQAAVMVGSETVGRVTRVSRHHEWGPIAYTVIKRNVDQAAELQVETGSGSVCATQELLVSPDAGATRREALAARRAR